MFLFSFIVYCSSLYKHVSRDSSSLPLSSVQAVIENSLESEYKVRFLIDSISIDSEETDRIIELYQGSEFAEDHKWTDQYVANHFIAVRAVYHIELESNHNKRYISDANMDQFFYLAEDVNRNTWILIDGYLTDQSNAWTA